MDLRSCTQDGVAAGQQGLPQRACQPGLSRLARLGELAASSSEGRVWTAYFRNRLAGPCQTKTRVSLYLSLLASLLPSLTLTYALAAYFPRLCL